MPNYICIIMFSPMGFILMATSRVSSEFRHSNDLLEDWFSVVLITIFAFKVASISTRKVFLHAPTKAYYSLFFLPG